jgi:hypothetical protein
LLLLLQKLQVLSGSCVLPFFDPTRVTGEKYLHKISYRPYFGVGTHKNYHQHSDTFGNVNHKFFHMATNAIYQQLIFIDRNI